MKGARFSLVHITVAPMVGFTGAVVTFFGLYHMFGQG